MYLSASSTHSLTLFLSLSIDLSGLVYVFMNDIHNIYLGLFPRHIESAAGKKNSQVTNFISDFVRHYNLNSKFFVFLILIINTFLMKDSIDLFRVVLDDN